MILIADMIFFLFFGWLIIHILTRPIRMHLKYVLEQQVDNVKVEEVTEPKEQTVIVKDPYFDVSKIQEYHTGVKKFIFRPQTLEDYIGQEKAKQLIRLNVKKVEQLRSVHFLISGKKGCGKTTVAHIIKNLLKADMIERVASELADPDQLIEMINEINSSDGYTVLFIDEIHNLPPKLCEVLYPIMEDFKIAGKKIKPFTLLGATTEKNILVSKVAPLVDRFQVQVELENYTHEDIEKILRQYHEQLYPEKKIPDETYQKISRNCKYTPRIAITLLEDSLIEPDIDKVFEYHKILKDGLTTTDISILVNLKKAGKPIGEEALAMMSGISRADYRTVYEPYLVEMAYVIRSSRGRTIGTDGIEILEAIMQEA